MSQIVEHTEIDEHLVKIAKNVIVEHLFYTISIATNNRTPGIFFHCINSQTCSTIRDTRVIGPWTYCGLVISGVKSNSDVRFYRWYGATLYCAGHGPVVSQSSASSLLVTPICLCIADGMVQRRTTMCWSWTCCVSVISIKPTSNPDLFVYCRWYGAEKDYNVLVMDLLCLSHQHQAY